MDLIPAYQHVTKTVKLRGKDVKVHALSTGAVAVKTNFRSKKGFGELAKINILLDTHYTEYMPIWVWVIEHPDGLLIIDTGEIAAVGNLDRYLAKESALMRWFFKHSAKFGITEKDELDCQFEKINLKPDDVKLVVLTHLHLDHTDGLKFFPKQEIIVGDHEFKHQKGNMPTTYPAWFKPNPVRYKQNKIDIFNESFPLTSAEDLLYVPTPGHTKGHSSVIFKTDDFDIIFAGDTSYNQGQVLRNELAGINADYKKSAETYKKLLAYGTNHKTIYLPTHDVYSATRLQTGEFLINH
ncbi:MAG TPA: N-acyl homoserine lactonase family protein [Puia sp.]|nr:N-acyl homoserine lactonase family protein [Puia sp.]